MNASKVLAICLDGYEQSLAEKMMKTGEMPNLAQMATRSARFLLDHGADLRTGLAGEHFATGMAPAQSQRWAAVQFDRETYRVWQEGTSQTPFPALLDARTVVFDPPYFDLRRTESVAGIVNWGAHDPGVAADSRPGELLAEVRERFGSYPASAWIYGLPWNSESAATEMGQRLAEAVRTRTAISRWLLKGRLPEWDLGIVAVSEAHSAIEGLWHGVDPDHPLHGAASAAAAGEGLRRVYAEIDALVGTLCTAFPEAIKLVFAMHGMGPNGADVASMLLLPELLYRNAFGHPLFRREGKPEANLRGCPGMDGTSWYEWVHAGFDETALNKARPLARRLAGRFLPPWLKHRLKKTLNARHAPKDQVLRLPLDWMPATRYQPFWRRMPAFALPSFYDGRIRINLKGRERQGMVDPADYSGVCQDLASLLEQCADPITGHKVVDSIEYGRSAAPAELGPTEADMVVVWKHAPLGLDHPELGRIGPAPYRRTGGHTGPHGFLYLEAPGWTPGDHGTRSAYDVVPTLFSLTGQVPPPGLSGSAQRRI